MNVELKPCPFCGGEAEMMGDQYPYVECQECAAGFTANHSYEFDEDDAASKWNARSNAGPKLKPIAESKVRQLGGDVCGVLVRNEAGAWAAVSEGGRVMWLDDFGPVPAARNEDVALPSHATKSDLIDCIDLMADEFKRIKALNPGDEISDLCDRALRVTEQNVPVLEVRDRLQKTVSKLLWKVSDLEDQLKAARSQSGQGAEPACWIDEDELEALQDGDSLAMVRLEEDSLDMIPLYTHPQPDQQGSVPSRDDLVQCLLATRGQSEGVAADAILSLFSAATPQPKGDGWIGINEKVPPMTGTFLIAVADPDDIGWNTAISWTAFWNGECFEDCDPVDDGQPVTHWRWLPDPPQPPKEGSGDE